jgi:hypothetical protein
LNLVVGDPIYKESVGIRQVRIQVDDMLLEPFKIGCYIVNDIRVCSHVSFITEIVLVILIVFKISVLGLGQSSHRGATSLSLPH